MTTPNLLTSMEEMASALNTNAQAWDSAPPALRDAFWNLNDPLVTQTIQIEEIEPNSEDDDSEFTAGYSEDSSSEEPSAVRRRGAPLSSQASEPNGLSGENEFSSEVEGEEIVVETHTVDLYVQPDGNGLRSSLALTPLQRGLLRARLLKDRAGSAQLVSLLAEAYSRMEFSYNPQSNRAGEKAQRTVIPKVPFNGQIEIRCNNDGSSYVGSSVDGRSKKKESYKNLLHWRDFKEYASEQGTHLHKGATFQSNAREVREALLRCLRSCQERWSRKSHRAACPNPYDPLVDFFQGVIQMNLPVYGLRFFPKTGNTILYVGMEPTRIKLRDTSFPRPVWFQGEPQESQ